VKTYGQFCPVAKASEIFATRWTPLILRELLLGARYFGEIEAGCPGISRSLLTDRLRELERAGIIVRSPSGAKPMYALTQAGQELFGIVVALGEWGQKWVNSSIDDRDINPRLLLWDMRRRINLEELPDGRTTVRFDFRGARRDTIWLVLERPDPSVCFQDPGFEPDLLVSADTLALHEVWMGRRALKRALSEGAIALEGPQRLERGFSKWLALSSFAPIPSAV
jgi:DNA-binding HxlR family transcriptional regulator